MRSTLNGYRHARTLLVASVAVGAGSLRAAEYHGRVFFNGLPVPGVNVTLTLGDKHVTTVTDLQGVYLFPDLADGTWQASLQMQGFQPLAGEAVVKPNADAGTWSLQLLSLQQMLATAHAAPPVVLQPRPAAPPTAKARAEKPAASGVSDAPRPTDQPTESASADGLLINGSDNNAATSRYSLAPAFGNRRPGQKSLYNGSLGVIASNSAFDARPYSLTGLDLPKASYSRVTFVATFGGPLNIPHLLPHGPNFFLAYQRTRDRDADTLSGLVPTAAQRTGDISSLLNGTTIYDPITGLPLTGPLTVSAQAQALLQLYPLPNLAGSTRYNYQTQVINNNHADALQSRLDKGIGRRDQVYGGFAFNSSRSDTTNLFRFHDTTGTLGIDSNINWSHRFPHGILTNAGYRFSRLRTQISPNFQGSQNVSGNAGIIGNDQDPTNWGPPDLVFASGISALTDGISAFNRNRTDALVASAVWTHRKHTTTFGGDLRRQEFNQYAQSNPRGVFTFTGAATHGSASGTGSDFADFLLGVPDTSKLAFGNPDKYFRQTVYDAYVTDDWRIRPEFTLNAGLRWDYGAPLTELKNRLVNLDVAQNFTAVAPILASAPTGSLTGTRFPTSLVRPDKRDVEPRVGIAWRPFPTSTMVIRAGYGIYVDTSVYLGSTQLLAQQAPLSKSVSVSNSTACPLTLANGFRNCTGTTSSTFAIDPDFRVGYAQIWRLSVQRDLPAALVLTGSYLGTKGTRGPQEFLPQTYPISAPDPCPLCARGYIYRTSNGNSIRHAAELQLRRRLRSGLTASVDYLYAKSIDDDSDLGGQGHLTTVADATGTSGTPGAVPVIAQNWLDLRAERSRSNFDQRHSGQVHLPVHQRPGSRRRHSALRLARHPAQTVDRRQPVFRRHRPAGNTPLPRCRAGHRCHRNHPSQPDNRTHLPGPIRLLPERGRLQRAHARCLGQRRPQLHHRPQPGLPQRLPCPHLQAARAPQPRPPPGRHKPAQPRRLHRLESHHQQHHLRPALQHAGHAQPAAHGEAPLLMKPLLLLFALLPLAAAAQTIGSNTPAGAEKTYTLSVKSQLVVETVVVTDKQGKPISGLTAKDFTVTEDGTPQTIRVFEHETLPSDVAPLPVTPRDDERIKVYKRLSRTTIAAEGNEKNRYKDHRLLALYFDMSAMRPEDQQRALAAAERFVRTQMTPADLLSILRYSGGAVDVLQDFTADRNRLLSILETLVVGEGQGFAEGVEDSSSADTGAAFGQDSSEFNIFNTDRQLSALQTAARMLGNTSEKKALLYFASGLRLNGNDNQAQLHATVDAAVRSGVSFWPVDARGLVAEAPLGDATQGSAGNSSLYNGTAAQSTADRFQQSQDTLYALAADTGGKALFDNNDLTRGITNAQHSIADYYLIGYYTTNTVKNGRFRKVNITLANADAKLDYRKGYYADKEFGKFNATDKERQLEDALSLGDPITELTIALELNYFPTQPRGVLCPAHRQNPRT